MRSIAFVLCVSSWMVAAHAADEPVYEPAPEWVLQEELPNGTRPAAEAPLTVLLWDQQVHIDAGAPGIYTRLMARIDTPQGLMELNTLSAGWSPSFQTLAIHDVKIRRDQDVIDVLGPGERFSVLRRESNLEYAMLDGALTAVLQPEGLRVGDVVDFAFTVSGADPALQGMVQVAMVAPQSRVERARLRAAWEQSFDIRWRATGALRTVARESRRPGETAVEFDLDNPEPYLPPTGAPTRYLLPPLIELSSFTSWQQVSAQMAPLFEHAVQLSPDSPVEREIERIRAAYDTPIERASAALRMVQDDVRYLYVALEQGGLVPASAEETWRRRFGDCKGKTALLLAMLRGLGIQAEPVLVDSLTGDALPDRLPMVGAFDHVLVRAEIDGHTYWLDGARSGDRAADHIVTPLFHWGLPLRAQGAALIEIRPAPLAEPNTRIAIRLDFSPGLTAPGKVEGEAFFTGDAATLTQQAVGAAGTAELDGLLRSIWAVYYRAARIDSVAGRFDSATGEYIVTMTGTVRSLWYGSRYRSVVGDLVFPAADFSRSEDEDQEAPFAVVFPQYTNVRETLILPNEGQGFRIDGEEIDVSTSGFHVRRSARIEGSSLIIEGSSRSLASELSASEVKEAERSFAVLGSNQLYVLAPTNYRASDEEQRAALGPEPVSANDFIDRGIVHLNNARHELAMQDFTSAVELAPTNAYALANRGLAHAYRNEADRAREDFEAAQAIDPNNPVVFRGYGFLAMQRANYGEAIEHFTRAIEISPDNDFSYNMRARARMATTDLEGAFEDSQAATRLNPAIPEPYLMRATVNAMRGREDQAIADLDAMLESANSDARVFRAAGQMLTQLGERGKAIDAITRAFEAQPTAGDLIMRAQLRETDDMNARRADLEAALELEPRSREARLGLAAIHVETDQTNEAIALLNELIERDSKDVVALGERGIAYTRSGDSDLAAADFDAARAAASNRSQLNGLCWRKATLNVALEDAMKDCLQAIELEASAAAYDSLGFVYLRLGRHEDSVNAYDSALGMRANQAHSLFGRALAKRELGDQAGYEQDMRDAVRWQPEIEKEFARYGVTH